jgi:integrase
MHKKLKHGIRPYKCDLCDKSFVQKGSLQVHRRQHMVRAVEMDDEDVPDDVLEEASAARYQTLPKKSKLRYEKELEKFTQWQTEKRIKGVDEDVMMAYFKSIAASSAWSRYSMLKSTLFVFKNVDISRFSSLTSFLKTKCKNYQPKKAATFSRDDVCKFLLEAPDQDWIVQKVVLIMGMFGGCRCDELSRMMISDVKENFEDVNPTLVVNIPVTKTGVPRSFTVVENAMGINFLDIYKKYIERRPIPDGRLFLQYRKGTLTSQVLGVNSLAKIPGQIAEYLKLPEKESFTGHSFRRTSVTLLADSGNGILTLKRHGPWESNSAAESYFSPSKAIKIEIAEKI